MSSLDTDADLISMWNRASDLANCYGPIFIYIFGIVGNFLNVLVLVQRPIRSNPSATFLIVSSIACLIAIISGLTSRMMSGYSVDLTLTTDWICKLRNYILYTARTVTLWLIALATVDRWLSSSASVHRRQLSTLKNARRGIILVFICTCLLNAPILYCYKANLTGALRGCYGSTYVWSVITDLIYALGTTIMPLSAMIIFGLLTIRNVRQTQNRVQNIAMVTLSYENRNTLTSVTRRQKTSKMDKHLLRMLAVQVTLLVILTCPHAIQKAYTSITSSSSTPSVTTAVANFVFNVVTLLNFTASGMPFYIYTLSGGRIFRNALFDLLKAIALKVLCR